VIRIIGADGELVEQPFADLDVAEWLDLEWGLTGLAVAPNFNDNPYLYAFYMEPVPSSESEPIARPRLMRMEASTNVAGATETIISDFPETRQGHQGFRASGPIHFGPDGTLYVSVGDFDYGKEPGPNGTPPAQDLSSLIGKMLRLDPDGSAPGDNPFVSDFDADSRVFAYGFARASDFAFQDGTGTIFSSDATDSCEEINVITAGGNYGWPDVGEFPYADCNAGPGNKAVYFLSRPDTQAGQFQSYVNVSGMAYLTGDRYPSIGAGLLICEGDTGLMRRLSFDPRCDRGGLHRQCHGRSGQPHLLQQRYGSAPPGPGRGRVTFR
jgi:glucose/arabinose dehydrogenase